MWPRRFYPALCLSQHYCIQGLVRLKGSNAVKNKGLTFWESFNMVGAKRRFKQSRR